MRSGRDLDVLLRTFSLRRPAVSPVPPLDLLQRRALRVRPTDHQQAVHGDESLFSARQAHSLHAGDRYSSPQYSVPRVHSEPDPLLFRECRVAHGAGRCRQPDARASAVAGLGSPSAGRTGMCCRPGSRFVARRRHHVSRRGWRVPLAASCTHRPDGCWWHTARSLCRRERVAPGITRGTSGGRSCGGFHSVDRTGLDGRLTRIEQPSQISNRKPHRGARFDARGRARTLESILSVVGGHERARDHPGQFLHDERELRPVSHRHLQGMELVGAPLLVVQQSVVSQVDRVHAGRRRHAAVEVVRGLPRSCGVLQRPLRSADQGTDRYAGSAGRTGVHVVPLDHARREHDGTGGFRDRVPAHARSRGERQSACSSSCTTS